jgi:hypothetical protein
VSRKLLAFLLSELKTFRIVCQGKTKDGKECGTVIEVPLERLAGIYEKGADQCRNCGTSFSYFAGVGTGTDPFGPLAKAIQNLNAICKSVEVEIVIPDEDQSAQKPESLPK